MARISRWISITERCSFLYRNREYQEVELCGNHHMYIFTLCQKPGISQDELAKIVHVNKSNVTRSLKNLEENGFIFRETSETDKRMNRIFPTEKAKKIVPFIYEKNTKWNDILTEGLSEEEVNELNRLMQKVTINACNYVDRVFEEE